MENDTPPTSPPQPVLSKWDHYAIALLAARIRHKGYVDRPERETIRMFADEMVEESNKRK